MPRPPQEPTSSSDSQPTPRWRQPRALAAITLLLAGSFALSLQAQQSTHDGMILHEYYPLSALDQRLEGVSRSVAARNSSSEPGSPPKLTLEARPDELVQGSDGPMAEKPLPEPFGALNPKNSANKLDDQTDKVDELRYFSSFDPSVVPYKRVVAQNHIRVSMSGDYFVELQPGTMSPIPIGGEKSGREDRFWGSFLIRTAPGRDTPLPSVAPDYRVLELQIEPQAEVQLMRDEAGNSYVRTNHKGLLRLNVHLAAPRFYFDGELSDVGWYAFDGLAGKPSLPSEAGDSARKALETIGISRALSPREALRKLVKYFRDFEGKPFSSDQRGEDLYLSIVKAQLGVCRHRSFAFVITAQALGIPAHYVYNEAHAFVEVLWPGQGWRRIDLGGSAEDVLMQTSDRQQRVHDGANNDQFPQPPAYLQELERLAEKGQNDLVTDGKGKGKAESGKGESPDNGEGPQSRENDGGEPSEGSDQGEPDGGDPSARRPNLIEKPPEPRDERPRTQLSLTQQLQTARRGGSLAIKGRLDSVGARAPAGQSVRILLGPTNISSSQGVQQLGTTSTRPGGDFEAVVNIPRDLPVGRWTLYLVYEGSEGLQPSQNP